MQVVADGTDSNSTNVALGYAQGLAAAYSQELATRHLGLAGAPAPPIEARIRVWFNARLESRVHIVISPSAGKQNIEKAVNRRIT